jgi:Zn-dependent peptidase ImmA (M78 family)
MKILEKRASEFRQSNGLSDRDCIRLKSLLHKLNVLTVFKPLDDSLSGMAIKVKVKPDLIHRFILVNSNQSLGRQHFTICHELYHLYIQNDFTFQYCNPGTFDKKDIEEYKADLFAAYFLIPRDGVYMLIDDWDELELNKLTLPTLLRIEQYFSCSRASLLYRLEEMGLTDRSFTEQHKTNVKKGASAYGYSTELYEYGNHNQFVGDYGSLAKELYDAEKISESHYHSLLLDLGINLETLTLSDTYE